MRTVLVILASLIYTLSFAQNNGDTKIIVTLSGNDAAYDKVKIALVKNNFIVKDDGNKDTLLTYPREFTSIPGYAVASAILSGNQVTLSGGYGMKKINDWGYTSTSKNYKRIIYYKGSKGWKLLLQVAEAVGGQISFSE